MRLDRLQRGVSIVEKSGAPSLAFQSLFQRVEEQIEAAFQSQQEQIDAIAAAQAAADAANAAASAAQDAADAADTAASSAQGAADAAEATAAITNSYPSGVTITATDAGSDATVAITGHDRVYANGVTVAVTGGSVTAQPYSTLLYIYYDQPSRAGGAVTYLATTSDVTAAQLGDRHLVGSVTTPAALGAPTGGQNVRPPGVGALEN